MTTKHEMHDAVIRVEVLRNAAANYTLMDSYQKEFTGFTGDLTDESLMADESPSAVPAANHG